MLSLHAFVERTFQLLFTYAPQPRVLFALSLLRVQPFFQPYLEQAILAQLHALKRTGFFLSLLFHELFQRVQLPTEVFYH